MIFEYHFRDGRGNRTMRERGIFLGFSPSDKDRNNGALRVAGDACHSLFASDLFTYLGPVYWTLVPEIFPNDIRGMAMTAPVFVEWIANAIVGLFFPYAFQVIGKAFTFGVLAVMAISQGVFTMVYVPETKDKSLEEIEKTWNVLRKLRCARQFRAGASVTVKSVG